MKTMRIWLGPIVLAPAGLGLAGCGSSDAATSTRFTIDIEHSSFMSEREMSFSPGETVTFVIRNDDPIDHEFILGDDAVQARHEEGTQRHHHGAVPGEVSVPAGETRTTTYTFSEAGSLTYACHLPGHFDYGMKGEVLVR
jgi:uncharacterized cupredoxin-like copper-binding protein